MPLVPSRVLFFFSSLPFNLSQNFLRSTSPSSFPILVSIFFLAKDCSMLQTLPWSEGLNFEIQFYQVLVLSSIIFLFPDVFLSLMGIPFSLYDFYFSRKKKLKSHHLKVQLSNYPTARNWGFCTNQSFVRRPWNILLQRPIIAIGITRCRRNTLKKKTHFKKIILIQLIRPTFWRAKMSSKIF